MLKFSVLIQITGIPDLYAYDVDYNWARKVLRESALASTFDEGSAGDNDYSYLAQEDGLSEEQCAEIRAHWEILGDDVTYKRSAYSWAQRMGIEGREISAHGIISKREFAQLMEDLGAFAEDGQTMGTLGGPLGGLVPDVSFRMETDTLIECIRATPLPCNTAGEYLEGDENTFDRLRAATLAVFGV